MLFSFQRVQAGKYSWEALSGNAKRKADVSEATYRRRDLTVNEIHQLSHWKLGFEPIPLDQLRGVSRPPFLTPEVDSIQVLRMPDNGRLLGITEGRVFYVLWIDFDLSIYNHGS